MLNPFRRKPKWDHPLADVIGDEAATALDQNARKLQQGAVRDLVRTIPGDQVTADFIIHVRHKGKRAIARYPIGVIR